MRSLCGRWSVKVGLIDVDSMSRGKTKFPNLALMKLSAWHKAQGDEVEWWFGFGEYDRVYMSRVFDDTYIKGVEEPWNTKEVIKGGTGYDLKNKLPDEVERMHPDYSLYPAFANRAYGFLTRGCPRGCHFCIVAEKEGLCSHKVSDLCDWWDGQKKIVLMDPNLLACSQHKELLQQLIDSKAWVDVNQGFDCRLLTKENIELINHLKIKDIHFAWDYMKETERVLKGLELYKQMAIHKPHGQFGTVYTLVNYDTTMEENLYRIYTLRDMGFDPYVMIYDKPNAPREIRLLQRWCNNRRIFRTTPRFEMLDARRC